MESRTGLTCSRIYQAVKDGSFPKPVPIGKHAVAWIESEVQTWVEKRIEARECMGAKPLRREFKKKQQPAAA